jgi:hypothetical protein
MIANPRFDAGRFRAPADDCDGRPAGKAIGCKLAGLAAAGAEEIAVDGGGDAGRFDVIVQILIETMPVSTIWWELGVAIAEKSLLIDPVIRPSGTERTRRQAHKKLARQTARQRSLSIGGFSGAVALCKTQSGGLKKG